MHDFPLVFHSNHVSILYGFQDITTWLWITNTWQPVDCTVIQQ